MTTILKHFSLNLRLLWNHIVFWSFPTPQEDYYSKSGAVYFEKRNYRKAIALFLKSEQSHNDQDVTYSRYNSYYLGHSYLSLGDLKRANTYFEKYFKLSRDDYQTASIIATCYGLMNRSQEALKWYQHALSLEPNLLEVRVACSQILAKLGRNEEALEQLDAAEAAVHDSIETKIIQSLISKARGDPKIAIEGLKQVLLAADSDWKPLSRFQKQEVYLWLSECHRESGDLEGARCSLESAIQVNPDDLSVINETAMEYANQGERLEEALLLINRALGYQPENPVFLDTKGWILLRMDRREEARTVLERCLELLPDYKDAREHLSAVEDRQRAMS